MSAASSTAAPAPSTTGSASGLGAIHQALCPARHRVGRSLRGPQTLLALQRQPQRSSTTVGVGGAGATPVGAASDHVPFVAVGGRQQQAAPGVPGLVAQQVQIAALEATLEKLVQKTKRQESFAAAYAGKPGKRGKYEGFPLHVTRCV
jgi:hypothetical protein